MTRLGVAAALVEGALLPGDVEVGAGGNVVAVGRSPAGRGGLAVPGLVDLQVNGWGGVDLLAASPDAVVAAAEALARVGTTAFQPTLITSPEAAATAALAALDAARARRAPGAAHVLGAHLEGPFLAPGRLGAHPPAHRRDPDPALLARLLAAGRVGMVTLAPELPGALELVARARAAGAVVALGHSDADAATTRAALAAGARAGTHVWNAMRPLAQRDPGIVGALLAEHGPVLGLIADGVHVADEVLALTWRLGRTRVALVSDAMAAAGLGDGAFALGDVEVVVRGGVARTPTGALAGATAPLLDGVRRLVALGASVPAAIDAATRVPALLLGEQARGHLAPGLPADVLVLDDALDVVRVLVGGVEVQR